MARRNLAPRRAPTVAGLDAHRRLRRLGPLLPVRRGLPPALLPAPSRLDAGGGGGLALPLSAPASRALAVSAATVGGLDRDCGGLLPSLVVRREARLRGA